MRALRAVLIALALALLVPLAGCGGQEVPEAPPGALKVGINTSASPPFLFQAAGQDYQGFDIDLIREVGAKLGRETELVPVDFSGRRRVLSDGKVDLLIGGLSTGLVREGDVATGAYLGGDLVAVSAGQAPANLAELSGARVAVLQESAAYFAFGFDKAFRDTLESWTAFARNSDLFDALDRGDVDIVLCERVTADHIAAERMPQPPQQGDTETEADGAQPGGYGISPILATCEYIILAKDEATGEAIQGALDQIQQEGTGKTFSTQWFGENRFYP